MKIAAIAGSTIPSDTANSLQVMKACQALVQIGHEVTLLVPGPKNASVDLRRHYGLQTDVPIEWLPAGKTMTPGIHAVCLSRKAFPIEA